MNVLRGPLASAGFRKWLKRRGSAVVGTVVFVLSFVRGLNAKSRRDGAAALNPARLSRRAAQFDVPVKSTDSLL